MICKGFGKKLFKKIDVKPNLNVENIKINGNYIEIEDNMYLDFGGIAKGYLADILNRKFIEYGFKNNLVNIGGDIFCYGKNINGNNWVAGIRNPFSDDFIDAIELDNESISTSGTYLRNWEIEGEKYNHIKNPFSQKCSELLSVSIISKYAYETDSLATAIMAMGLEKAIKL